MTIPAPRKTAIARAVKKQTYSTSEGRANFAKALARVNDKNTVIGFDRYGTLIAAVVSVDAVRMLAGRGEGVDSTIRDKIERMARIVLLLAPLVQQSARGVAEERVPLEEGPKEKRKRGQRENRAGKEKRGKDKDKKKRPASARSKRPPKIRQKI